MDKCPGCDTELKFMNTPNFGGGKLKDGRRVCRACFKIMAKHDVSFGLKSKKNFDSEMVIEIVQGKAKKTEFPERPIPTPKEREISIPEEFEDDIVVEDDLVDNETIDLIDSIILIEYKDAKGNVSTRRITIKKIDTSKADPLLKAYCHERKAARSFKISRISEIVDIETGEIFQNAREFLIPVGSQSSEERNAMLSIKDELLIMTYMAKADGVFHENERFLLKSFIMQKTGYILTNEQLISEIGRFHCSSQTFLGSLKSLANRDEYNLEEIFNLLQTIAASDGNTDQMEQNILDFVKKQWQL